MRRTGVLILLSLSLSQGGPGENLDAAAAADDGEGKPGVRDCAKLGFPSVACSTCQAVIDIVADEGLSRECLQCCHQTKRTTKKYALARLVYDPRLLNVDAELRGFIEKRAADHPNLKLQPRRFAKAELLMSEEGQSEADSDVVSIERWKVDSIADYLVEHL